MYLKLPLATLLAPDFPEEPPPNVELNLFLKSLIINPNYNLDKVKRFDFVRAFEAVSKTLGIFTFKEQRLVMHQFFMYFGWLSLLKFIKRQWFF